MKKINITILYGSSCVGKSTIMAKKNSNFYKIEMDDSNFWKLDKSKWANYCLEFLSKKILENTERKDIIATCGGLPLPNDKKYLDMEKEYNLSFNHILVLTENKEEYIKNILERGLEENKEFLIKDYNWRETTIKLYDNIIVNKR